MLDDRATRLRPLSVAEILDEAVELYKINAALFIGISAVFYLPVLLFGSRIFSSYTLIYSQDWKNVFFALAPLTWFVLIAGPIVTGALTYAVSERYLGREVTIAECFKKIWHFETLTNLIASNFIMLVVLFIASIIPLILWGIGFSISMAADEKIYIGIIVLVASALCLILPAFLLSRLVLSVPSVVLEGKKALHALKRSFLLSKSKAATIFLAIFIVLMVTGIVQAIIILPVGYASAQSIVSGNQPDFLIELLGNFLQAASSAILMPASSVVIYLLYIDCRIRKEGYDLTVMAEEIAKVDKEISENNTENI